MNRILLTINKLNRITDCESTFLDIVQHFEQAGWYIDIIALTVEGAYLEPLMEMQKRGRLNLYCEETHVLAKNYQLIWVCQGYMSITLIDALQKGEISGVCVFQHYHNYADKELPYGAALENHLAWRSLTVSTVSFTRLALKGLDQRKLQIFPLSVSDEFCRQSVTVGSNVLSRALLVSGETSDDISALRSLLAAKGISLEFINTHNSEKLITPEYLQQFQLVLGASRTAVQALSLGIPVYITNAVFGGGYITDSTFEEALNRHFSADKGVTQSSAEMWLNEIIENFSDAQQWAKDYRHQAVENWSLNKILNQVINQLPQPQALKISENEAKGMSIHRKVMTSNIEKTRVLENWLEIRQPSAERVAVLKSFLQQYPTAGDIGVVIINVEDDSNALSVTLDSLEYQYWPAPEIAVVSSAAELSGFVSGSGRQSLLVINAGTRLLKQSLLIFAEHCLRQPDVALWYCDSVEGEELQSATAQLLPDFNLDLFRSQPYIGNQLLMNVSQVRELGGLSLCLNQLAVIDLAWRVVEKLGSQGIGHISDVLFHRRENYQLWTKNPDVVAENLLTTTLHLQRCGLSAVVEQGLQENLQRVRFDTTSQPMVSVIIPTRNRLTLLRRCIESLMEKTRWNNYELVIVDNGSTDSDACEYLNQLSDLNISNLRVVRWPQSFNFAAINNFAVQEARGDILLFLNNDTHIIDSEWMVSMVEHALRPEVAIVGPRIETSEGRIQNAGYATGVGHGVSALYENVSENAVGYLHYLQCSHNVTAVSAACMMMRKDVFEELGGFDGTDFPLWFADIDLALKAKKAGYLTVWTPHARLEHMGAATLVQEEDKGLSIVANADAFTTLRNKWRDALNNDIGYNRQLAKIGSNFSLTTRHADFQQPLPGRPLPVMMGCYKNTTGCGNYRVIMPYRALAGQLSLEGGLMHGIPSVMEVAEVQPDILLLELFFDLSAEERIRQYREVSNAKIIMEYDDYVLNLPLKSAFRKKIPKNIATTLRRTVENADWLVVSTEPLAEAYAPFHHDIRVAKNRLGVDLWGPLKSARRQSHKPRVGWAGGSSHTGDLEILLPFIKELENEVEWVFMGMKPDNVKCEYHSGVPFDHYPEKLASLNLDLALVPLEQNLFNECKSNLRLLELGACGVPVICTDIAPYRCGLPVTLVQNRYRDWMNAIREHLSDWGSLAARGDALRAAVHSDWMLRENGLIDWQRAWLPR